MARNPAQGLIRREHEHGRGGVPGKRLVRLRQQATGVRLAVAHTAPRAEPSAAQGDGLLPPLCGGRIFETAEIDRHN